MGSVPFISGTIPANVAAPAAPSESVMREDSEPPAGEGCFHAVTEGDEVSSLEDSDCI